MKNSPKKPKNSFTPTEVGVMLEGLESKFQFVIDDVAGLKKSVEEVRVNQASMIGRVTLLDLRMGSMENRMESMENLSGSLANRMESVENKVDLVLADTTEIRKIVANHETRISRLEKTAA